MDSSKDHVKHGIQLISLSLGTNRKPVCSAEATDLQDIQKLIKIRQRWTWILFPAWQRLQGAQVSHALY